MIFLVIFNYADFLTIPKFSDEPTSGRNWNSSGKSLQSWAVHLKISFKTKMKS